MIRSARVAPPFPGGTRRQLLRFLLVFISHLSELKERGRGRSYGQALTIGTSRLAGYFRSTSFLVARKASARPAISIFTK